MNSERCQKCGLKTVSYNIFKSNDDRMVCQKCRHIIDYDTYGRPTPPRQINSIMGIKMIIPLVGQNTEVETKPDCYYYDMCRERYGLYFNCGPCKVYSKHRGDY